MVEKTADLIVAMTGASGSVLCVRLLQRLRETPLRAHLVASKWGIQTLQHECRLGLSDLQAFADVSYSDQDLGAAISSGSFRTIGMVVLPCSMKTLACIANGTGSGLIHRAADVVLKERRRLVIAVRETPLNDIHLENMLKLSRMGATIFPPVPTFYALPKTVEELVDHSVSRILDQFGEFHEPLVRWQGMRERP